MARVAEGRAAAEPTSAEQRARYLRILEVAAELASDKGLERVQMHEVAKGAGVAIGTLYRYFPSKTHLFVGVMADQMERLSERLAKRPRADLRPDEAAFAVLQKSTHALMRRPALAMAMISSSNAANAATVTDVGRIDRGFRKILLDAMGLEHPTAHDITLLRLLLQLWYGVLQSSLNGRISMPDAESDVRLACRLLLAGLSNAAPGSPPPAQD
ncbi:TetR family transcriptional regulator [Streptomyces sp. NPDC059506]|uniref:TetR family transcriptional regulator n=1 Tax=unclassified Streptomyces TaxID=2593676 RepID=UPI000CA98245|nr:TetR family transcriptional regulator [Streptomyces sp. HB2AG]MCZ2528103.1 TetR family transcriptional regulator [Streptomyces sp. HB2AG]PLW66189.1 TetR family transcriptional regulator [Streptomyces sp. DJ]